MKTPLIRTRPAHRRPSFRLLVAPLLAAWLAGCTSSPTPPPPPPTPPSPAIVVPPAAADTVVLHPVNAEKELIIRNLRVVESDRATRVGGPWHISTLLSNMAPAGVSVSAFTLQWLRTWEAPQTVENGRTIPPRPELKARVLDPWLGSQAGLPDAAVSLDWSRAPFRLLAIVSRMDLARLTPTGVLNAGEGRFVFGVLDPAGNPTPFTIIFEYSLQATNLGQVRQWARAWHDLGNHADFNEDYLAALQRITDAYSGKGVAPARINGSPLNQIRTDEIALRFPWELREFELAPPGLLKPRTVAVTPDLALNNQSALADFLAANSASILATNHDVPVALRAASSINEQPRWSAPGFEQGKVRFLFALSTCSGCHGPETALPRFTHIDPRPAGAEAGISAFLTDAGATIPDPEDSSAAPRTVQLSDLSVRKQVLSTFASQGVMGASRFADLIQLLQTRQNRVH